MTALSLPRSAAQAAVVLAAAVWSAVALAGGWFAAQAALRWLAPAPVAAAPVVSRIVPSPAAPLLSSPGRGATGTIALPRLPAVAPTPGVAARAFSLAGIAAVDRGRALQCLATAVYYEAASESDDGQRAVAQVVLNRVRHPAFPGTVCGTVYQGSERAGCQFSFACDGAMARAPSRDGWARALRNAAALLNGQVFAPVGWATHYHTFAVTPAWNRTLVMTDAIGAHFFHRWKGFYGTPAAFTRRYRGGEPLPGPHVDIVPAEVEPPPALAAIASPAPERVSASAAVPALPESTILDRWKDTGKPLR
ncbi:cell wall hydrolase [Sphingomonas corticis]|uniref:Cell wall hydrolase n=1 Tax=Sphingomonas corticis TaxID=2722791 RepID=A0ABX1CQ52_9SPHN|nr:cell wall hydrolase [Sphingomonas corticis]